MCQICSQNILAYQNTGAAYASLTDSAMQLPQYGGSGANTWGTQGSTSNVNINGVLSGDKWAGSTLTYSFPTLTSQYDAGYGAELTNNFLAATAGIKAALGYAMGLLSQYTNLATRMVEPTEQADVRVAISFEANPTAYAYYPGNWTKAGDIWYGSDYTGYTTATRGEYEWATSIHELGHALGLKHGHETGGPGSTALQTAFDQMAYSVMTYRSYVNAPLTGYTNESFGYAQTFMMYDIAALQTMYGANFNTNSGNSTYTWSATTGEMFINGVGQGAPGANRVFLTVWDGNGTDTYDFSNYATNLTINLAPGAFSITSATQLAYLGSSNYAPGNIFNVLQFNGDVRSLIENANGGSGNDTITGNAANNDLDGRAGNDTMAGQLGNDTYHIDNPSDGVIEVADQGWDTVVATFEGYTLATNCEALVLAGAIAAGNGNAGNNMLVGNASGNTLNGGAGADTMYGGAGNDTYHVDNISDNVVESSAEGAWDSVYATVENYRLADNCEALVLGAGIAAGNGNATGNAIYGNSSANTLNGGGGADTMFGGAGNDTYHVDNISDNVVESSAEGAWDSVYATVENYRLADNCEALVLGAGIAAGNGNATGNAIYGNTLSNYIDGGAGNDVMIGGDGNDTYVADSAADQIVETSTSGAWDSVYSTISGYVLAENCEALVMVGSITAGNGNAAGNAIYGNAAHNFIVGLGGADTLFGGGGNDTFYYTSVADSTAGAGSDIIMDFASGSDFINLSAFDANTANGASRDAFAFIGTGAFTAAGQLRYESGTGDGLTHIYGDINGDGTADFEIRLSGTYALTGTDFVL